MVDRVLALPEGTALHARPHRARPKANSGRNWLTAKKGFQRVKITHFHRIPTRRSSKEYKHDIDWSWTDRGAPTWRPQLRTASETPRVADVIAVVEFPTAP